MNRSLVTLALVVILWAGAPAEQNAASAPQNQPSLSRAELEAAARLSTKTIRDVTTDLASPEMEGRGTAQRGGHRAAAYLAKRFADLGLKPHGDDRTYLQEIPFRIERALPESSFRAGDITFKFREDFVVVDPFPAEPSDRSASLVFVGYAAASSVPNRDDFAGVDVKGKIVVVLDGKPRGVDEKLWDKFNSPLMVFTRLLNRRALAVVSTYTASESERAQYAMRRPFSVAASYAVRRQVSPAAKPPLPPGFPPSILISPDAAERLFEGCGISYAEAKRKAEAGEFVSRDLGKQASLSVRFSREQGTASNVVGVVEGSDAELKNQAVVYTAHYDAYGIDSDGTIFPGAADNALGVGKLVATAEVFARMRPKPRRSILFIALTAEEYGLLGSLHWLQRPTWPLPKVAADINYDGIGTDVWSKMTEITDVGFGHSDLGAVIASVAAANNIAILPDAAPEEQSLYRTDAYSFWRMGVPALSLKAQERGVQAARRREWEFKDYHMPTDTVRSDWEWDGARMLTILGLITGMRIANREAMPVWHPFSPYNRPRGSSALPDPR